MDFVSPTPTVKSRQENLTYFIQKSQICLRGLYSVVALCRDSCPAKYWQETWLQRPKTLPAYKWHVSTVLRRKTSPLHLDPKLYGRKLIRYSDFNLLCQIRKKLGAEFCQITLSAEFISTSTSTWTKQLNNVFCLDQWRIAAQNKRTRNILLPVHGTVTAKGEKKIWTD